ncbi:AAA family ATPase [Anaerococcus vaginalis]|uniref:AAA family ATPase n=1 Tax=Anaerococcus vaginalis TaxID=33037 RepID=UPI00290680BD|nr:AAA family ATPase [Anaerococcus vaginalis]MDU5252671.1 AAA family ATPase [Anaerococcus vaginalis]MDU6781428.1 AAA family ATPase [Anaerococcus vaginalis]
MEIIIKKLSFKNFKGFKEKEIDFEKDLTNISGDNATGKTTIFDGFSWLLWGKDSQNRKDYEIKPYQEDGENIHNVETIIEGVLSIDGKENVLKRVYKEVWKKKRGSNDSEFSGHTTDFYINEVPKKKKEYEDFISEIVNEDEFNLLSNPMYFNTIIDKKERRKILLSLVDDVSPDDIFKINKDLKELDLENYTIDELKAMAKSTCKKINEKLIEIPARIDELNKAKTDEDFTELESKKERIKAELEKIDKELAGARSVSEILDEKYEKISELKKEVREIVNVYEERKKERIQEFTNRNIEIKGKLDACKFELENAKDRTKFIKEKIKDEKDRIKETKIKLEEMREEWEKLARSKCDDSFICPTCGQEFPEEKQEEIKKKFNLNKSKKLEELGKTGKKINEDINKYTKNIEEDEEEIKQIEIDSKKIYEKKNSLEEEKEKNEELIEKEKELKLMILMPSEEKRKEEIKKEIEKIEEEIKNKGQNDNTELLSRKRALDEKLDDINSKVSLKGLNSELDRKIEEYEQEEKKLSCEFEEKQKILYLCEEYIRAYTELVSEKVNNLFTFVKFKLFDKQINGGIQETAEATYKGVPYGSLNNAAKINAGLDIINALAKKFEKQIPIFVDNAESVNELVDVDSQLIRLVVSKYKNLRIEK